MQKRQIKYFLGTNSSSGFYSLFNELYDPEENWKAYIIKGGPGTGKSSFMGKIAQQADAKGYECERIYCSSDIKSLDAVILPQLKICIADGTAPHIIEPKYVGVVEKIINLTDFWDYKKLRKNNEQIRDLYAKNSEYHQCAQRFLTAASSLFSDSRKLAAQYTDYDKLINYTVKLAKRELGTEKHGKKPKKRLLSAITPDGLYTFSETMKTLCDKIIIIDDPIGEVSEHILGILSDYAKGCGYESVVCPSPTNLNSVEQILIPELSLAIARDIKGQEIDPERKIHARRFMDAQGIKNHKYRIGFNKKAGLDLQNEAISRIKSAYEVHNELEKYYIDAVDFGLVEEKREQIMREMGL
ncbi:MAG: hypothetical protein LBH71_03305 [Oscillospiraceae bacterium]|jgi:hypothetical protein|nr:hypothetical protein [Oscillospiraceae bacterium]